MAQVSNRVPLPDDLVVVLAGNVAITLLRPCPFHFAKMESFNRLGSSYFFVLIFPGNIAQYVNQINAFGLDTG